MKNLISQLSRRFTHGPDARVTVALLAIVFAFAGRVSAADSAPGVVGEYFSEINNMRGLDQAKKEPFLVRTDAMLNFGSSNGDFEGSHLFGNLGVRWTGMLHVAKPGKYTFDMNLAGTARLSISGKVVIEPAKPSGMKSHTGDYTFESAGNFPINVDYQVSGNAHGLTLSWQAPGDANLVAVPTSALMHEKSAENVKWDKADWELYSSDHHAWIKKHGKPYEKMDYGPFLSGTFKAQYPAGNTTLKGIIVSLDKEHKTNILFDTEMCRYSAGWTNTDGEFIDYNGVAYNGSHGVCPAIKGTQIFGSPMMPGWEHDGSWKDPRKVPYGNLPADWCHYRGLYRSGDQVVFSYTVNGVGVLDTPISKTEGNVFTIFRTLNIDASSSSLKLLIAEAPPSHALQISVESGPKKVAVRSTKDDEGREFLEVPPHSEPVQFSIVMTAVVGEPNGRTKSANLESPKIYTEAGHAPSIDFAALMKGGPGNWGEPIVTKGSLGKDDGPYTVDTITPPSSTPYDSWMRISGFDFFPDGHSAAVCTWNGDVWIVKGIDDKLDHLTWTRYATGLFQSLGLKIVNGEVYVCGRDQITRLHDLNGDGEADFYENFNNDCQVTAGFHEFQHDLETDSEGNFYYAKGGPVNPGGRGFEKQSEDNGCMMKISADGKHSEIYATGMRAPNGMSMGPNDMLTVSDNQGTWVPACRISFVTKGSYLGVPDTSHMTPKPDNYGNPIVWFPYVDGDYTQGDNSSGGAAWDTTNKWGPLDGRMIHLSYGTCSIFEVMYENIDGIWQGGVCRFPLDFDSGIMRARFNSVDGQLYVAGLKGWQTRGTKDGCFQRVRYTGKPVHMPTELHVLKGGITLTFTSPVDPVAAVDPDNYSIEWWNMIWSNDYGSPDVLRDNAKKKGHDTVEIAGITISPDHKTVTIKINDLKPVMLMKTVMKIKAADGSPMNWEVDSTVNVVPGQRPIATAQPTGH